jgi:hypothetical protein
MYLSVSLLVPEMYYLLLRELLVVTDVNML